MDALTPGRWVLHPGGDTANLERVAVLQEGLEEGGRSAGGKSENSWNFLGQKIVCSG